MNRRRKLIAYSSALFAIAVLAVAAFASSGWVVDQYWIWRLEHGNPADRDRAALALAERGSPAGLPHLLGRLTQFLGNAEPGAPALQGTFNDNVEPVIRLHRKAPGEVTAALCGAMSDARTEMRSTACFVVSAIGTEADAEALAEPLASLVKWDPEYRVRVYACKALGRILPKHPEVRQTLEDVVQGKYPVVAGPINAGSARRLRPTVDDPDTHVRKAAMSALLRINDKYAATQR